MTDCSSTTQRILGLGPESMNRLIAGAAAALTFTLAQPVAVHAAEIKIWTARAIATVLADIGPQFERTTDHLLDVWSICPPHSRDARA